MKREPMGNEREQDSWLGTTLRRSPATASDACLDAETLAAWADGGLSAKAAAAVELHASSCSRCMAVLAAMERTAPAASATHAWTPARLFRWAAPLAAAATAVAIWVVGAGSADHAGCSRRPHMIWRLQRRTTSAGSRRGIRVGNRNPREPAPEPGTRNQNPAPSTQNLEPQVQVQPAPSARLKQPAAEEQCRCATS